MRTFPQGTGNRLLQNDLPVDDLDDFLQQARNFLLQISISGDIRAFSVERLTGVAYGVSMTSRRPWFGPGAPARIAL